MPDLSIETLMSLLPEIFLAENAAGISAAINFELSGEDGGDWSVLIRDKICNVLPYKAAQPDLILQAHSADILSVFTGRLDPARALLFGKLKMTGDMSLALRLAELFNTRDDRLRQWKTD